MRVLLISSASPHPPKSGGAQRTNLLHRALSEVAEVDLVVVSSLAEDDTPGLREHFKLLGYFVWRSAEKRFPFSWLHRFKPRLADRAALALMPKICEYQPDPTLAGPIRRMVEENDYDLVVFRYLRPAMKSGCLGRGVPAILDLDDVDSHVYLSRLNDPAMRGWERWVNRWILWQVESFLPRLLRRFDFVWLAHDPTADLKHLKRFRVLPNISFSSATNEPGTAAPAPTAPTPDAAHPPVLLFVGTFDHVPNESAVDHFIRHVWPAIRRAEPTAIFRVVGSRMGEERRARWAAVPGVEPVGFVEELTDAYAECQFTVTPIFAGAGTNIKVLESLAHGRTTVVTSFAHRPFAETLKDGESLRVAGTDEEFAAICVELLRDPAQRDALAAGGQRVVGEHFSYERFRTIVAETVNEVVRAHSIGRTTFACGHLADSVVASLTSTTWTSPAPEPGDDTEVVRPRERDLSPVKF